MKPLLASLPSDAGYRVDLAMGPLSMPTALHLPRSGEGTWYIPMRGNIMVLPAEELVWDGNAYQFNMQMRLGRISGDFVVSGEVQADGAIQGTFDAQGGFSPFQQFQGIQTGSQD